MAWLSALDGEMLLWLAAHVRAEFLNGAVIVYTTLGNFGALFLAVSLVMLCFTKTRRAGALALCALALGFLCTNVILKPLVARVRPFVTLSELVALITENDAHSFPSGHTTAAFAAAGIYWRALPRWAGITAMVLAVLMGLSRLYTGVHYPSDVLAGACIGLLCALVVWRIAARYMPHAERRE